MVALSFVLVAPLTIVALLLQLDSANVELHCQSIATPTVAQGSPSTTDTSGMLPASLSKAAIFVTMVSYMYFA